MIMFQINKTTTFKGPEWDKDTIGDAACEDLFKKSIQHKQPKNNKRNKNIIEKSHAIFKKNAKKKVKNKTIANMKNKIINKNSQPVLANEKKSTDSNVRTEKREKLKNKGMLNVKNKSVIKKSKTLIRDKTNLNEHIKMQGNKSKTSISRSGKQKRKKKKNNGLPNESEGNEVVEDKPAGYSEKPYDTPVEILDFKQRKQEKIKQKLTQTLLAKPFNSKKDVAGPLSLRERMMQKLKAARFRYLNEQIYSNESKHAHKIFKEDPDAFKAYHEGYRQQVRSWPLNPLDVVIKGLKKMPKTHVIADFGCGEAKLASSVEQQVRSFDLVATNDAVTACDMAHVPLGANSVDVVVFCLSLMGTNLHDYLLEANRVLKVGGLLKIAEVESRFENINNFIDGLKCFHFKNIWKDLSNNLFYFLDFKKESNIKNKKQLPTISLNPCLYKKR